MNKGGPLSRGPPGPSWEPKKRRCMTIDQAKDDVIKNGTGAYPAASMKARG